VALEQGGYYCPTTPPLPKAGEKLTVGHRKATVLSSTPQVSMYGSELQVIPGLDSDCSVTVQYYDALGGTETLSAAEKAQPWWLKDGTVPVLAGYIGLIRFIDGDSGGGGWQSEKERHEEMVKELGPSSAQARPKGMRPKSGEFWGSSEESDDGDQAVRTTLTFKADGTVRGRGWDGEDGAYRITNGVWGKREGDREDEDEVSVGWIEQYDQGFQVVVEGFYDTRNGKIEARFRSSRGVGGRFMLFPKPSIF